MNEDEEDEGNHGRSAGVGLWGFGSMVAITLSWSANHSIFWMILQGIFQLVLYDLLRLFSINEGVLSGLRASNRNKVCPNQSEFREL
jgi:hypothetical protein